MKYFTPRHLSIFIIAAIVSIILPVSAQQQWYTKTTPMPSGRQMYGAAVLGDYIYIIGGNDSTGFTKSVSMAPIAPNGALGNWRETTPLPALRSYISNSTIVLNDIVYIVTGWDGDKQVASNSILWSRPKPNGELERWNMSPAYPGEGLNCNVAVATPGYIHVLGGEQTDDKISQEVWSARTSKNGSIAGWEKGTPLPVPLWFHCGGVAGGRVWIWGGLTAQNNTRLNSAVYSAPILSSGRIGVWQATRRGALPQPFYSASSSITGAYLLTFCPKYRGGAISNDVWYTTASDTGLGQWKKLRTTLPSKGYIGLGTDYRRGNVYIPGGRVTGSGAEAILDANVYFFQLAGEAKPDTATEEVVTIDTSKPDETDGGAASRLSYTQVTGSTATHSGFYPYAQAADLARAHNLPMIMYFFSERPRRCKEQKAILEQLNVQRFKSHVVFAEVDSVKFPQMIQQYGVFRVPHWIVFDKQGNKLHTKSGVVQAAELESWVNYLSK